MVRHSLPATVGMPIPAAQPASSLANVVPFTKRGRLAKREPKSTRSSKTAMPLPSAPTAGRTSGWDRPKGVILDFAPAYRGGHVAKAHEYPSNENEPALTVSDGAAIAYVVVAVAFYPVVAWLLSP